MSRFFMAKSLGVTAAVLALGLLTGCADDAETVVITVPTTVAPIYVETPADEQERADQMLAEAMKDGEFSEEEFETLILETVACAERAGLAASVKIEMGFGFLVEVGEQEHDLQLSDVHFSQSVTSDDPNDPGYFTFDMCTRTFFYPAVDLSEG